MKLAWVTDIHLNFLEFADRKRFYQDIVATKSNAVLVSGDIAEAATISDILLGMEYGYDHFKFFPAEVNGGVKALKAFAGPLADINFCPTGGVSPANYKDYLALPNVLCVGGSWIVPKDLIEAGKWDEITALAKQL